MDQNFIEMINQRTLILAEIDEINDKLRIVQQHKLKQYTQLEEDYLQAGEIIQQIYDLEKQQQASCIPCCGERKKIKFPQKAQKKELDYKQIEKDLNIQLNQYENELESLEAKLMKMSQK
ncbi:hypothetical protein pb186bvf_001717 [Paramecium bursaria]